MLEPVYLPDDDFQHGELTPQLDSNISTQSPSSAYQPTARDATSSTTMPDPNMAFVSWSAFPEMPAAWAWQNGPNLFMNEVNESIDVNRWMPGSGSLAADINVAVGWKSAEARTPELNGFLSLVDNPIPHPPAPVSIKEPHGGNVLTTAPMVGGKKSRSQQGDGNSNCNEHLGRHLNAVHRAVPLAPPFIDPDLPFTPRLIPPRLLKDNPDNRKVQRPVYEWGDFYKERGKDSQTELLESEKNNTGPHREEQLKYNSNPHREPPNEVIVVEMTKQSERQHEIAFTDSGYGSNLNHISLKKASEESHGNPSASSGPMGNDDACTLYSGGITIATPTAQMYISEICNDVYKRLCNCVDANTWMAISNALPDLVKGFAVKLGNDSDAQANRDVMYFVHKWCKDLVEQLEGIFTDDIDQFLPRPESGGMGLLEKMDMWKIKEAEDREYVRDPNLFEGVHDKQDNPIEDLSLDMYHKTIFGSQAYEWFISNCRKEVLLQWEDSRPRTMAEIRQRLLGELPRGIISKKHSPKPHRLTFIMTWDMSMAVRLKASTELFSWPSRLLPECIAITGSPIEAHASTLAEYMEKIWPINGLKMLDSIKHAVIVYEFGGQMDRAAFGHDRDSNKASNEYIVSRLRGGSLEVEAVGSKYFIAECGEQLGWLFSALQNRNQGLVQCYEPLITHISVQAEPLPNLEWRGICDIGLTANPETASDRVETKMKSCWQTVVGGHNLIQGYPISRRPAGCAGLELSFNLLLHLMQAKEVAISDSQFVIEGLGRTVKLAKKVDDVCVWHLSAPAQNCLCYENSVQSYIPGLESKRHILGTCQRRNREAKGSKCVGSSEEEELSEASAPQACASYISRRHSNDFKRAKAFIDGRGIEERVGSGLSSPFKNEGSQESISSAMLSEPSFHFQSTPQTETDDLSLDTNESSSNAEYDNPLCPNEPLYPVLSHVLYQLLIGFRSQRQRPSGSSQNSGSQNTPGPCLSSTTASGMQNCQKRKRGPDDENNSGEDGTEHPPGKRTKCGNESKKSFACPYLKHDPLKHRDTCARQLSRIRDVKQHLSRRHTPRRYCQRCLVIDFNTEASLQEHIRLGTCEVQEPSMLEGISHDQRQRLARKSDSKLNEEDQWFVMWEIIFPGCPKPSSAYIETGLSAEMRIFSEYSYFHGPALLRQQIMSDSSFTGQNMLLHEQQVALDRIVAAGLRQLFASWRQDVTNSHTAPQRGSSQQTQQTPLSFTADSGIAMESQAFQMEPQTNGVELWGVTGGPQIGGQPFPVESTASGVYDEDWRTLIADSTFGPFESDSTHFPPQSIQDKM